MTDVKLIAAMSELMSALAKAHGITGEPIEITINRPPETRRKMRRLTDEELDFIRQNSSSLTAAEMAQQIGVQRSTVKSVIWREKLPRRKGSERRFLTADEIDQITRLYPIMDTAELARQMNLSVTRVQQAALRRKINKSEDFLRELRRRQGAELKAAGVVSRFSAGHKPWNCGLKTGSPGRSAETQFKPGAMPHNWVPVGSVAEIKGGYLKIKIAEPNKWRLLNRHNWEQVHGAVPAGFALEFIDGDRKNCSIENLRLISRRDLMARNTVHNLPEDLKECVQLLGALKRRIKHGKKQAQGCA